MRLIFRSLEDIIIAIFIDYIALMEYVLIISHYANYLTLMSDVSSPEGGVFSIKP